MKGVSTLISYVLIVAIIIGGIGLVLSMGRPMLAEAQDAAAIDEARQTLTAFDATIRDIANQGRQSRTTFSFSVQRGSYGINTASDTVRYTIETTAGLISPNASRRIGNLVMAADGSQPKQVSLTLNYTDIDLRGFNGSLGSGFHELELTNRGANNTATVIEVGIG